jgi:hypothetical protein
VIDCIAARDELLDAAPDELAGVAPTELGTHVRDCRRCGPLARMFLDEQARLGATLSLVQPRRSAGEAADEVLVSPPVVQSLPETRRERVARYAATLFPMAAAAALAAWLVYGDQPTVPYPAYITERAATAVRITAPTGTGTIVLNTNDPDITFAWIGKEIDP